MNNQKPHRQFPVVKKNRFYNHENDRPESFLFGTIPSVLSSFARRKKRLPENKSEWAHQVVPPISSKKPLITWIGHASFLIQVGGVNILTDPVFGQPSFLFPRILPPGILMHDLPPIDFVLLSHNHPDHCHVQSLQEIKKRSPSLVLLVPKGDKQWLEQLGFTVSEYGWWDSHSHAAASGASLSFTFLPAHHWSAKGLFDWNKSLWGSWMIAHEQTAIYFAGDTAYAPHFKNIAQEFTQIHVALMPIGPGEPHTWMCKSHMNAPQAVQAFLDLGAQHFIPMHWGTFQFGSDTFLGPVQRLQEAWQLHQLPQKDKKLSIVKVGQQLLL